MKPTDRMIQEELRREAANLPIPPDMWQQINQRLDQLPQVVPQTSRKRLRLAHWRTAVAVAAAGLFWLTVVPATRLADQNALRPAVPGRAAAAATEASNDNSGPYRSAPIQFTPHPHTLAAAAAATRVPTPLQ